MLIFLFSFFFSAILIFSVRSLSVKLGYLVEPRDDRWHHKATPTLGGVGLYISVVVTVVVFSLVNGSWQDIRWGLLLASSVVFCFGLYDDINHLTPQVKLLGQFLAASVAVFSGISTSFFTPRIENQIIAQFPNIALTFIWLIGITNAINLLDNMDGLAGGIAGITACILSYFFWNNGASDLLLISLSVVGSVLGFLVFNFPPASIFMGDSGSMFLGFTLAVLAIARQPQASNVFAVLGVPTLLFLLPIVDTLLVTITRLLRGQSPMQGGKDHTSHRLIAFGLNERQAVISLYAVAATSGLVAIVLESLDYDLSLVLIPLLIISLALFTAYLGRIKVITGNANTHRGAIMRWMIEITYRRRLLEVILDFFLISATYYLAFWSRYGFRMGNSDIEQYLQTLPVVLLSSYISFFIFGVYRGVWRYVGFENLLGYIKAAIGSLIPLYVYFLLTNQAIYLYGSILLLFGAFLLLGLAGTRSSFNFLDMFSKEHKNTAEERILIYGTKDTSEFILRWILMNPQLGYKPVGLIDEDRLNIGRRIHGVEILGGSDQLGDILKQNQINGLILTLPQPSGEDLKKIKTACEEGQCWMRTLNLEFEVLE